MTNQKTGLFRLQLVAFQRCVIVKVDRNINELVDFTRKAYVLIFVDNIYFGIIIITRKFNEIGHSSDS